jgi:hypothetical protein
MVLLVGLVVCGAILAGVTVVAEGAGRRRTVVRQHARGGQVINSTVEADSGARVCEVATGSGRIQDVHTRASDADVSRNAHGGVIEGGSITAK